MAAGLKILLTLFVAYGSTAHAFEAVTLAGDLPLIVQWQPTAHTGRRPAIIALHGCGGLYNSRGRFDARYTSHAERWNSAGWHVVAPDSLGSRDSASLCRQAPEQRAIKVAHRRADVLRTAAWLATRGDVDASRIAIVGWSHGASTALEILDRKHWPEQRPVAIVVYYPACSAQQRRDPAEPVAPLLMLLGDADDWTPPGPCKTFADRIEAMYPGTITMRSYSDAYHGFDGLGQVRFRSDIPAGLNKRGVHVGGNPAAREASLAELDRFLSRHLK